MKIKTFQDLSNIKDLENLIRFLSQIIGNIQQVVNGNLSFSDNLLSDQISFVFPGAQEVGMPHTLGMIPTGYIDIGKTVAIQIFDGTTPNTVDTLYLKSNGAGTVRVLVF